jgi:hypothetical protein
MSLFKKNAKTTDLVPAVPVLYISDGGETTGLSLLWTQLLTSLNMLLFCGSFRFVYFKTN